MLASLQPTDMLQALRASASAGAEIALGDFRTLVEALCYHGRTAELTAAMDLLPHCPHCTPLFVDVLIERRDDVAAPLRIAVGEWAANRLMSESSCPEYEALHLVRLLGTDEYAGRDVLRRYLSANGRSCSPIIVSAIARALHPEYEPSSAASLLELSADLDRSGWRTFARIAARGLDAAASGALVARSPELERDAFVAYFRSTPAAAID
jgi:hypothetical protein